MVQRYAQRLIFDGLCAKRQKIIFWVGEGNGNPLHYPCLENPMDGGARQATVHGVAKRVRQNLATEQQ